MWGLEVLPCFKPICIVMITLGETIKNLPNLSTSFQFNSLHILWAPPCSFTWKKAVGLAFLATRVSWQIGRVVKRYRPPTAQQSISGVPLDFPGRGMIAVVILWHVLMLHYCIVAQFPCIDIFNQCQTPTQSLQCAMHNYNLTIMFKSFF